MTYLIAEMIVALTLATILGAAIGWLMHRSAHNRHVSELRQTLMRQKKLVAQAQSDVDMLTDDYDDLQRRAQEQVNALQQDNQRIPELENNLEQSQKLFRQTVQRHESKVRELSTENTALSEKLKALEDHEQALNNEAAERDGDRRKRSSGKRNGQSAESTQIPASSDPSASDSASGDVLDSDLSDADQLATDRDAEPDAEPEASTAHRGAGNTSASAPSQSSAIEAAASPDANSSSDAKPAGHTSAATTQGVISNARSTGSWASAPLSAAMLASETSANAAVGDDVVSDASEIVDEIDEIDQIDQIGQDTLAADTFVFATPASYITDEDFDEHDVHLVDDPATESVISANANANANADAVLDADLQKDLNAEFQGNLQGELHNDDPFDDVMEVDEDLLRELDKEPLASLNTETVSAAELPDGLATTDTDTDDSSNLLIDRAEVDRQLDDLLLDGSSDKSSLFDPVEQHDDLKQIFGIGPLTEKALNDMGITSYSQLADLQSHDIETIAEALQIVPGRIERDDWVGNARRQLEDVLEEL